MATKKTSKPKPFKEASTGEKYPSKSAMMKHEKGESKSMKKMEMKKGSKKKC
jgi:hypothetical protein